MKPQGGVAPVGQAPVDSKDTCNATNSSWHDGLGRRGYLGGGMYGGRYGTLADRQIRMPGKPGIRWPPARPPTPGIPSFGAGSLRHRQHADADFHANADFHADADADLPHRRPRRRRPQRRHRASPLRMVSTSSRQSVILAATTPSSTWQWNQASCCRPADGRSRAPVGCPSVRKCFWTVTSRGERPSGRYGHP